ncbi:phosphotransferase, partial [Mycobacterium tuberculosis]|uniref:phosphotransferase n=1 Tax=Mycobacterium tuberculosis TaxID=1773 RepID=UPI001587C394
PVSTDKGWGWADQPNSSWRSFLRNEVSEKYKIIGSNLGNEDHNLVVNLVNNIKSEKNQFLLHGDCGVHNFIFESVQLKGVIDPTPVVGDPLYDLIYAFCSSPDDLTKETIDLVLGQLR